MVDRAALRFAGRPQRPLDARWLLLHQRPHAAGAAFRRTAPPVDYGETRIDNTAFFGSIAWDVTDRLALTAELRRATDNIGNFKTTTGLIEREFTSTSPRVTARYRITTAVDGLRELREGQQAGHDQRRPPLPAGHPVRGRGGERELRDRHQEHLPRRAPDDQPGRLLHRLDQPADHQHVLLPDRRHAVLHPQRREVRGQGRRTRARGCRHRQLHGRLQLFLRERGVRRAQRRRGAGPLRQRLGRGQPSGGRAGEPGQHLRPLRFRARRRRPRPSCAPTRPTPARSTTRSSTSPRRAIARS